MIPAGFIPVIPVDVDGGPYPAWFDVLVIGIVVAVIVAAVIRAFRN